MDPRPGRPIVKRIVKPEVNVPAPVATITRATGYSRVLVSVYVPHEWLGEITGLDTLGAKSSARDYDIKLGFLSSVLNLNDGMKF